MKLIGIDPGLSGGIGFLSTSDGSIAVADMPTCVYTKTGKQRVDYRALRSLIAGGDQCRGVTRAYIEQVSAMPGQGTVSMFSFGGAFHGAWAVCECLGLEVRLVTPQTWKRHYGLTADKKESLALARKMFPGVDLSLVKHGGRAEALLIAAYGRATCGGS